MEKWSFLDQNHGLIPWEKSNFFFLTSDFYRLKRRVFVLPYRKAHFSGLYWLKECGKWPYFDQNHGVSNPFGKMSIFRLFGLFGFFSALKGLFPVYNIVKHIFLAYIAYKRVEEWLVFYQNHGLTSKSLFRLFLTFCPKVVQRRFLV